jgi:hypothetical protein
MVVPCFRLNPGAAFIVFDLAQQCEFSQTDISFFRLPKPLDFYTVLAIETRDGAHTLVTSKTERKLWTTKNPQ